jgi:hypothetical protein
MQSYLFFLSSTSKVMLIFLNQLKAQNNCRRRRSLSLNAAQRLPSKISLGITISAA